MNRLGKIRLGVWVERGDKSHPESRDYFVCPPEILAVIGDDKPRELEIMFPVDDPEVLFPQALKAYRGAKGAGKLWCYGDGQVAYRRNGDGPERVKRECPCELLEQKKCEARATLNFLLPDVPGIGVWQIETGNKRSIVSLNSDLETYRGLFGGLRGIPFTLKMIDEPMERWDEAAKRMRADTAHVLKLDTKRTLREIVEWRKALGRPVEALMLPEADDDEPAPEASPEDEWDISMAYSKAAGFGLDAETYGKYLAGVYPGGVDNMTAGQIADQETRIKGALADPAKREEFVAAVRKVAGAAKR